MASLSTDAVSNTVKNVFEGPFFELDVALTMGVMKHRRKPGISSKEGQKWWRQLMSRPLMWDLRSARRRRVASTAPSRRAIVGTPRAAPVVVLVRHDHEVAVAQRLDVLGRVLRAEAEAQDLDDVLDLRCVTLVTARRRRSVEWRAPSHKGAASGASRSLVSVRTASKSKKKPPTSL